MGALTGSITATAYYVEGDLPSDFRERYTEALRKRCFKDIDLDLEHDESLGWVTLQDPFDTDFMVEKVVMGDYIMVGLRQDTIRLPAAAFRLHLRKALAEYLAKTGKDRASKAEQEEVRDHLEKTLKRKVLPAIKVQEMVWNLDRKEVWFFTGNKRMNEVFMDLFTDTFEVPLIPRTPYSRLERMGLDQELIDRAIGLEPSSFAVPAHLR